MSYSIREFGRGRVVVLHEALVHPGRAAKVHDVFSAVQGVRTVNIDTRDGSLALEYDPQQLNHADLFLLSRRVEALLAEEAD